MTLHSIGRSVQALIAVRIPPTARELIEAFRDWVAALSSTIALFVASGNGDLLIHVAIADTLGHYSFVRDRLTPRREVAGVRTSIVDEQRRTNVIEPIGVAR